MNSGHTGIRTQLRPGQRHAGFDIVDIESLPDFGVTAVRARHEGTGADVLHLANDDVENVFSVNFLTPPPDSTGVAHILEHSVLAGSKRFPMRDAFNELGRSSLRSFLNAFTGNDYTCYPVASTLGVDFYNLADVYFDLVFQPRLSRHTFMQEGHHLEVDADGNLFVTGIVYNEMKGAFATGERILFSTTMKNLLPDTAYGVDAGGYPDAIPDLTYDDFLAFYRRCYSPQNSRIFFYGSIPTERHLDFLGPRLDALPPWPKEETAVALQPRWTTPRVVRGTYPATSIDATAGRSFLQLSWLTCRSDDVDDVLALDLLAEATLGNPGSPLRRALVESPHGSDMSPLSGVLTQQRDVPFTVGLRGSDPEHLAAFEKLALSKWGSLRDGELDADAVSGAVHQLMIDRREVIRTGRPYGLGLMMRCLPTWNHHRDPLTRLRSSTFERVRSRATTEPRFFADLIDRYFISNPHRLTTLLVPEPGLSERQERARVASVRARQEEMTAADIAAVKNEAEILRAEQRAPASKADLRALPRLELSDIPVSARTVDTVREENRFEHDMRTNGLGYLDLIFDLRSLPAHVRADVPLLAALMWGMGAGGQSYGEFASRKSRYTRGVTVGVYARNRLADGEAMPALYVRTGALETNIDEMTAVVDTLIHELDLTDRDRLRTLVASRRHAARSAIMPRGHTFVRLAAASALSPRAAISESWEGVDYVRHLSAVASALDREPAAVVERLQRLRDHVMSATTVLTNLVGDEACRRRMRDRVATILERLPRAAEADPEPIAMMTDRRVGIPWATEVAHTARVIRVPRYAHADAPVLAVASAALRSTLLYQKIRVEGGAYGAFAVYDAMDGQFALLSYRDPRLDATFSTYDDVRANFLALDLDEEAVRKAIITTIASMDVPRDPRNEAFHAVERAWTGLDDGMRQIFRERVLAVTAVDLRRVVDRWLDPENEFSDAALASSDRLAAASPAFSTRPIE